MSTDKGHPTRDELLAMAYVDGELALDARAEVDARMATDTALARGIVEYQRLQLVAVQAAPPEPMDYEWQRLERDDVQRAGLGLGWALLFVGSVGVAGYAGYELYVSQDLELVPKLIIGGVLLGLTLLFLFTLRARLRTLPYDPYTQVRR